MNKNASKYSRTKKVMLKYTAASVFCLIFAMIYEEFSFGVTSRSMECMFLIPLFAGAIPNYFLYRKGKEPTNRLQKDGILALTLAACVNGVLEIYGTSSTLIWYLVLIGIILYTMGTVNRILYPCHRNSPITQ